MNVTAVAPKVEGFGTTGQATATQLFELLYFRNPQMTLEWNPESKHFTLTGFHDSMDSEIEDMIHQKPYVGWKPKFATRTAGGDIIIQLKPIWSRGLWVTDEGRRISYFEEYLAGKSVLDVGCGNGRTTARLAREIDVEKVTALEPGAENEFLAAKQYLSAFDVPVERLSLQEAVQNKDYLQQFDAVTVFNYNVPMAEKEDFIMALSQAVKPDGVVIITSVEMGLFHQGWDEWGMYLVDTLKAYFQYVKTLDARHGNDSLEQVAICQNIRW